MTIEGVTEENIQKVSKFFKSISDPTRLRILLALSEEEMNVTMITQKLGMEQSAISHQLKLLRENYLVKSRKEGKTVVYSLDDQHVTDILIETFLHMRHVEC
ncbi:ArsR/SmtB family transcription factor [Vagococcus carniphilus]|uniref:Transcriptional regulator n=1 Tax=Vagococcus carniphilus TaxID=218144 RepID=A0A430AYU1_9ENTE|nr:metalloregulator ArsR/SmtB family transcription factor [Vagococcus carniphilus]QNN72069.1 winged helix-turn-helix transcriptional regulator [Vagococcus carniphilus]RSU13196.1 transcriptional regulator [Vagococcus carniphilus]